MYSRQQLQLDHPWFHSGIMASDGWNLLIHELLTQIETRYAKHRKPLVDGASIQFLSIKQKHGTLTIYCDSLIPIDDLLDACEAESATRCEICGATGSLMLGPFDQMMTRCPAHTPASVRAPGSPPLS